MARPRMSPEAKTAKKERAAADKAAVLAQNALAKLPAEKEKRDELWQELEALKSEASGVSGSISAQKKRMTEVFGITKAAMQIRSILNKCRAGEYEATVEQVQLFMQDTNRPIQLSMKLEPGKGVASDEGSVFDKTNAGEHVEAERGDDPGRARKRTAAPPAPPAAATPNVGVEGLAAGIKPLDEKKSARKGPPAPTSAKPAGDFEDGKDVRPRHLQEAEAERAKEEAERKAAETEAAMKDMTPSQKRAYAKKIAEEAFTKRGDSGLGSGGFH
ncbi:hypothetical protein [Bosea minatitlanensis]|uniref:DUF2312 domain-containing protein n=1 Tax=Bosea minatitlanensis TaxID=128782 RepID=A0ABW0F2E4_9HYPH|nr:hypothetical protein [Bosea minatitlanensis]MCT4492752.1 hypothetical protein [Bosea minatitlanensis]